MACHLSHKLPWDQIQQMYIKSRKQALERHGHRLPGRYFRPSSNVCVQQVRQFAYRLVRLLKEFKASDQSTHSDIDLHDPEEWGEYYGFSHEYPLPSHIDEPATTRASCIAPIMLVWNCFPFALGVALGSGESGNPYHLVKHPMPAFAGRYRVPFAPFTGDANALKILRDHAAMLFRCMYSVSGENQLLDQDVVEALLFEFFDWSDPKTVDWEEDHNW